MTAQSNRLTSLLIFLGGVSLVAYMALFASRDWIGHDEGLLGLTALSAGQGRLPHRDFEDPYTGGLAYWHAGSYLIFGQNILATRLTLLASSAVFLAAVYAIARHAVGPWPALGVAAVVVVWGTPNYFAALPSWYNSYLATFGALALLRFRNTGATYWLVAAGACAGLSILMKIIGLYFVAAGLLYLAFVEQQRAAAQRTDADRSWPLLVIKVVGAAVFTSLVIVLIRRRADPPDVVHFILPGAALAWLLAALEYRDGGGSTRERLGWLTPRLGAFVLGVAIPTVAFALPYLASGSLNSLLHGVFVAPQARIEGASRPLPPTITLLWAIPLLLLLVYPLLLKARSRTIDLALTGLFGLAFVAALPFTGADAHTAWNNPALAESILLMVRPIGPLLAFAAVAALLLRRDAFAPGEAEVAAPIASKPGARPNAKKAKPEAKAKAVAPPSAPVVAAINRGCEALGLDASAARRCDVYLLVVVAALTGLVQFPWSTAVYFFYSSSLTILAALYFIVATPGAPRRAWTTLAIGLALFAIAAINFRDKHIVPGGGAAQVEFDLLELSRGQILVTLSDKAMYEAVAAVVSERAPPGQPIWAGSDCPEVPFLCERENISPALYDVLSGTTTADRATHLAEQLDRQPVKVAVVNMFPDFSPYPDQAIADVFEQRFPNRVLLGRFCVYWRD